MKNTSLLLVYMAINLSSCSYETFEAKNLAGQRLSSMPQPQKISGDTKSVLASTASQIQGMEITAHSSPTTGVTRTPDGNVADLIAKMSGIQSVAQSVINQSSAMKYQTLQLGTNLEFEQCLTISQKIAANYKISPFKAIYNGGSSFFNFCTDENGVSETTRGAKFYFNASSAATTKLGLATNFILTKIAPDPGPATAAQGRTDILLDANYKMLEITYVDYLQTEAQANYYSISSLDASGNFFMNWYYGPGFTGTNSYETHRKYISADGMYSFQQDLKTRKNDKGTGQVLSNFFTVSDANAWSDFFIVLSHAWSGGFYDYAGQIQIGAPKANSTLYTATYAGTQVCADGSSSTPTTWTNYPSPTATAGSCANDW